MSSGDYELRRGSPDVLARPTDFPKVVQWLRDRETPGPPPRCLIRPEVWRERGQDWLIPAKFGSAWGLSVLNAYSQSMPQSLSRLLRLDAYAGAQFDRVVAEGRGLSAVAGRYIVTSIPVSSQLSENADLRYRLLARFDPDLYVYENTNARPLATLVTEVRLAEKDQDAADGIIAADSAVRELAYVVPASHHWHDWQVSGPTYFAPGIVRMRDYKPDDIVMEASAAGDGFLVLAVTRTVGWSASVDGMKVPIYAVDGPLMGVRMPPGEHIIRFRFRPLLFWFGIAAATVGLGGAWLGVFMMRHRAKAVR